jgi:hypothetical protein
MVTVRVQFKCDGLPARNFGAPVPCSQSTEIGAAASVSYEGRLMPQLPDGWSIVVGQYLCDTCSDQFRRESGQL